MNVRSRVILDGISLQMLAISESEVTSVATLDGLSERLWIQRHDTLQRDRYLLS